MYRRTLICLLILVGIEARVSGQELAAKRPNILFVISDDQRYDTIRALGNKEIQTPNLDKLVGRGFVFHNTYCQGAMIGAVCTPSRTMVMTGRSLFRISQGKSKPGQAADMNSLGGLFRSAGYATLFVGKPGNTYVAGNKAFETVVYQDKTKGGRAFDSQFMADTAITWLKERKKDRPFFVYLGPPVPHDPRLPPEFMKMYDRAKIALPPNYMPKHPFDNGDLKIRDEMLAPFRARRT